MVERGIGEQRIVVGGRGGRRRGCWPDPLGRVNTRQELLGVRLGAARREEPPLALGRGGAQLHRALVVKRTIHTTILNQKSLPCWRLAHPRATVGRLARAATTARVRPPLRDFPAPRDARATVVAERAILERSAAVRACSGTRNTGSEHRGILPAL